TAKFWKPGTPRGVITPMTRRPTRASGAIVSSTSRRLGSGCLAGRIVADTPGSGSSTVVDRPTLVPVSVTFTLLPRKPPRGDGGLSVASRIRAGAVGASDAPPRFGGSRNTRLAAAEGADDDAETSHRASDPS